MMKKYLILVVLLVCVMGLAQADQLIWPPQYQGTVALPSQSHGGGYSPYADEFWMPHWSDATVYRYDRNYNYLGTFNSGQGSMMQLWGEADGSYYTANWGILEG